MHLSHTAADLRPARPALLVKALAASALLALSCAAVGCSSSSGSSADASSGSSDYGASIPQDERAAEFGDCAISEDEVTEYTAQFRQLNGYDDDISWSLYLGENGYTGTTWRENVIRTLASQMLVEKRADELGITADGEYVESTIASLKTAYGIEDGDDEAWDSLLEQLGTDQDKLRSDYEFASIEQQVILHDAPLSEEATEEEATSYIETSLADQVVRRFSVVLFEKDDEAAAQEALDELSGLSGDALTQRFDEYVQQQSSVITDCAQGDLGWSLNYSLDDLIDGEEVVKLQPGDLYGELVADDDYLGIFLCTDRFVFGSGVTYADITDDALKAAVSSLALSSNWSTQAQEYISGLLEDAHVQVYEMPEGLPYDLTPTTDYEEAATLYGDDASSDSAE